MVMKRGGIGRREVFSALCSAAVLLLCSLLCSAAALLPAVPLKKLYSILYNTFIYHIHRIYGNRHMMIWNKLNSSNIIESILIQHHSLIVTFHFDMLE